MRVMPSSGRYVADGERVPAGDTVLRVVHTPGHAPDHVCLYEEQEGTLFCGDLLITDRTVVIPASYGGDLKTIPGQPAAHRVPGAGSGASGARAGDRRPRLARAGAMSTIAAVREAEILAVLGGAPQTNAMLVDQIYTDLPKALRQPAGESVLAHLLKLRDEGRVRERDGAWELRPPTRQC